MKKAIKISLAFIFSFCLSVSFAQAIETIEDDTIEEICIQYVEIEPEFIGGNSARINYLLENTIYPQSAIDDSIEGTVYVTFVVEVDSSITNIKILRGVCESLDNETLRVVSIMPKWKPGTRRGKIIRCQYYMPLKFSLDK